SCASADDISSAFRRLAKKYHPDLNIGREHEVRSTFVRVQKAFEVLSDPTLRARYDSQFESQNHWGSPPPTTAAHDLQPIHEFQIEPSSFEPAITLPPVRRPLDPELRKLFIFIGVCIALAAAIVLFA
ncbi:MAG TPA: J domain-containing protein, partial [Pirellulales bacterium]